MDNCRATQGRNRHARANAQRNGFLFVPRQTIHQGERSQKLSLAIIYRASKLRAMTLIEILIVLTLIALLFGSMTFGSGFFTSGNKRAAASLIVAGVRKGLAHANTTGKPCRLALNFSTGDVVLEQAFSRGALRESAKEDDEASPEEAADNYGLSAEEIVSEAEEAATSFVEGKTDQSPSFTPVEDWVDEAGESGRSLGRGIVFRMLQTEHDEEPIVDGVGYLHFWPGGETERAVVQLGTKDLDDPGYTVMISALTGRATIERGRKELEQGRFSDEEYSEREAP